jgi:hypothetical protein
MKLEEVTEMACVLSGPLTTEKLRETLSRTESSERITMRGTQLQALLTLAGQIRSPKAQKLKCLLDTLSQSEVTLAGGEFIMLLRFSIEALSRQARFGTQYIGRVAPWTRHALITRPRGAKS